MASYEKFYLFDHVPENKKLTLENVYNELEYKFYT